MNYAVKFVKCYEERAEHFGIRQILNIERFTFEKNNEKTIFNKLFSNIKTYSLFHLIKRLL